MNHQALKTKQRNLRENFSENLGLRVHRAISWLGKAEQYEGDLDEQFIFLWIAFNAAYANELYDNIHFSEQETFKNFIKRLCELDADNHLENLVWHEFTGSIRVLLANKYVFKPFWEYQQNKHQKGVTEQQWQNSFKKANASAYRALGKKDTQAVLAVIFSRLYTLRNQLLHGGATYNSKTNREQMRDAVAFLSKFVPIIINTMMDNSNVIWGDACFPVVV